MRKILLLFVAILAFCLVSSGGCGGDDDSSSAPEAVPSSWTELSGTWQPVEGTITYYYISGSEKESCTLTPSDNVDLTLEGSGTVYDVTLSEGEINFEHSAGESEHTSTTKNYTEYGGTGFTASGGTLSWSQTVNKITNTRKISYVNNNEIKAVISRKEGEKRMMKAEVTFERIN